MKAVILAGGTGSRLYPASKVVNKHLLPICDKPMIYYPLTILIASGISEFCLITNRQDIKHFKGLLSDGSHLGISIEYVIQDKPNGIARALLLAEGFIGSENFVLMLGDNFFSGSSVISDAIDGFESGATIFAYRVSNPSEYGVVSFLQSGKATLIEEKPKVPKSKYAVPGIYIYDARAIQFAKNVKKSQRGEVEITDVNNQYLLLNELFVKILRRGYAWLDSGTPEGIFLASTYIQTIEKSYGQKIGCPEEASFLKGNINLKELNKIVSLLPNGGYKDYLDNFVEEHEEQIKSKIDSCEE